MRKLAIDQIENVRKVRYTNAVCIKYNNKHTYVSELKEGGYDVLFRVRTDDSTPRVISNHIRGKMMDTYFKMTPETAEVLLFSLAELMGYKLVEEVKE